MGHSCPTCGKDLNMKQGMRQHHTKVHDEPLPNRTCKGCGTGLHDSESNRTFCNDCSSEAGRHNGNWKGAKEATDCRICGETFEYYPSDNGGIF